MRIGLVFIFCFFLMSASLEGSESGKKNLFEAIEDGELDLVLQLLDEGISPDITREATSAIMVAAEQDTAEILQALLDGGANVAVADSDGYTPLMAAIWSKQTANALALIKHGAPADVASHSSKWTPWLLGAGYGNVDVLKELRRQTSDIQHRHESGQNALALAIAAGHILAAEFLLEVGVSHDAQDHNGWTPLFWAVADRNSDAVEILLDHGAPLDQTNRLGWTPLMWSAAVGDVDMCQLLLERGADAATHTEQGTNARLLAERHGYHHVVTLLDGQDSDRVSHQEEPSIPMMESENRSGGASEDSHGTAMPQRNEPSAH